MSEEALREIQLDEEFAVDLEAMVEVDKAPDQQKEALHRKRFMAAMAEGIPGFHSLAGRARRVLGQLEIKLGLTR